jgi:hypothetical protein
MKQSAPNEAQTATKWTRRHTKLTLEKRRSANNDTRAPLLAQHKQTLSVKRRMSTASVRSSKYCQRLGILRTVDLSGETLETYKRRAPDRLAKQRSRASKENTPPPSQQESTPSGEAMTALPSPQRQPMKAIPAAALGQHHAGG